MTVEIKNITKKYGKKSVLNGASFTAKSGECIAILGGNGSGKSTLLSILAGIIPASGGEFLYDGKNLFEYQVQRTKLIGYVPQGTPLIDELTAKDNLSLWYDKKTLKSELESGMLSMLGIDEFIKVPVHKMSGGMKKRLAIGCAISKKQPVLLLDEPMAALDLCCKQIIVRYIQEHTQRGGIVLLVTHDIPDLSLCDKQFILKDGILSPFTFDGNVENLVKSL